MIPFRHFRPDSAGLGAFDRGRDKGHAIDAIINRRKVAIGRNRLSVQHRFNCSGYLEVDVRKRFNERLRVTRGPVM